MIFSFLLFDRINLKRFGHRYLLYPGERVIHIGIFTESIYEMTDKLYCLPCDETAGKEALPLHCAFEFVVGNLTRVPSAHDTGWRTMPFHFCGMRLNNCDCEINEVEIIDQKPFRAHSHDLIFIPAGATHRICEFDTGEQALSLWIHFRFRMLDSFDAFDFFDMPNLIPAANSERLFRQMKQLVELPYRLNFSESVLQQLTGAAFCAELLSFGKFRAGPDENFDSNLHRFQRVMHRIENSDAMPPIAELAKMVNLSNSRFRAVFHQLAGMSPVQYFESVRFRRGCLLLTQSDYSIGEIAGMLGYCSLFHFSTKFHKRSGFSPSEFRLRHRTGNPAL